MNKYFSFLLVVVIACSAVGLYGQGSAHDRLKMARAFEQGSDVRQASRLFQEVYAEDNSNSEAFLGVVRTLTALQQFEALVPVVKKQYELTKKPELGVLLGQLYWKTSNPQSAEEIWRTVTAKDPNSQELPALLGNTYSALRLFDRAITEFVRAREISEDPAEYADELVSCYTAVHNVTKATEEVLLMYSVNGDINRARGRLSALMSDSTSTEAVLNLVRSASNNIPNVMRLQQWVLREAKRWQQALEITVAMEEYYKTQGHELLAFADGARRDGQYDVASAAYSMLLNGNGYDKSLALSAAYGFAKTLEQKFRVSKELTKEAAKQIIDKYQLIVEKHPQHPLSGEAMFNMATIYEDVLGNVEESKRLYGRVLNQWKGTSYGADAGIHLSKLLFAEGTDLLASQVAQSVVSSASPQIKEQRDAAMLLLADYVLYSGNLDGARASYSEIVKDAGSNSTNDALDRLWLLLMLKDDSIGVTSYIRGLELEFRRRYVESVTQFRAAWKVATDAELRDRSALKYAELAFAQHEYKLCEEPLQFLISRVPETIYGDRSLVLAADIFELQDDKLNAIAALTTLLVQYPKSIIVPQARQRIRLLRGDA
ncbi:MAG: tetratricopeptide repeat protein [Ignavibacteria bacterium]|nr:tetratricopeptide repeat protein [Ignavibacteria bacterium]